MSKKNSEPVSYGYRKISLGEARQLSDAWLDNSLPQSQWQIVAPILKEKKVPEVAALVIEIIKRLGLVRPSILDVGCSSGYYYDFFKWAGLSTRYVGCDVSPHFVALARKSHRGIDFKMAPMTELPFMDGVYDIVLASGVLHTDLGYRRALVELARVSKKYILLHRLPVFSTGSKMNLSYYKKIGYGVEMMEIVFDWKTLLALFSRLKLNVKEYLAGDRLDIKSPAYWSTILLEKHTHGRSV
ncbi:hypothetical protein A2875_02295 [Candidatus Gottesmanbacteria bacterium RIFCSPHIGHO2_01_FULL_46_14]|uniref:Methyltransferase type 11 domain-containing protein n=1 Tax=Candidatus Gottesmanbacteria bacterium RIFCSPHIGHO2_01_FULL_46_14 TaxID=1798380 RepID=A0A1F5ZNQ6_9BACT|nr:MAG: methyltransferase type 11 [Microgenomates group bacterium GW2011_GWC1_39_7]OGG13712.1 MAG: hypothetical protein A2875_02295 [Candidatus Gottesmanbacteria bacterium RIFCSPHIGHO2_01_FULL_46_14]